MKDFFTYKKVDVTKKNCDNNSLLLENITIVGTEFTSHLSATKHGLNQLDIRIKRLFLTKVYWYEHNFVLAPTRNSIVSELKKN